MNSQPCGQKTREKSTKPPCGSNYFRNSVLWSQLPRDLMSVPCHWLQKTSSHACELTAGVVSIESRIRKLVPIMPHPAVRLMLIKSLNAQFSHLCGVEDLRVGDHGSTSDHDNELAVGGSFVELWVRIIVSQKTRCAEGSIHVKSARAKKRPTM
ncbi:hypothetical protein TNCV_1951841 [Trichonephila clavipes]|nr:hypothetical protein TNCV_1951841 [Trichonephila clavipes]